MDFSKFDTREIERYTEEAKQKWGSTNAWQEFEQKQVSPRQAQEQADGIMGIFAQLGSLRDTDPASGAAQALVARLQALHHRPLLYLHQGDPAEPGADVYCR